MIFKLEFMDNSSCLSAHFELSENGISSKVLGSALVIYDISFLRLAEIMSKYRAYTTDVKPSDI